MRGIGSFLDQDTSGIGALLRAAQAPQSHGQTVDSYGGASATPVNSNGGVVAPEDTGPSQAGVASISSPAANLISAYQKYFARSGHQQDPLAARGAKLVTNQTTAPNDPLGALARVAFQNHSGGDREGMIGQAFELNGQKYHVYVDRNGKRQVFRIGGARQPTPSISAAGSSAQRTT